MLVADPEPVTIHPILDTFAGCSASAKEAADSRVLAIRQIIIFVFIVSALRLSNHLIRPRQNVGWNYQADLIRGLEVDVKFELGWLLDWEIGGCSPFQNLVDEGSG